MSDQNYTVLDRNNPLPPSQDFKLLRSEGIEHIARLASDNWTDYNTPDPGITLLEAICYAMTEMGYRTGFDMKDLLSFKNPDENAWNCVFYTAHQLLHNQAITINDYRKLLIDIPGVRNVWLEPSKSYEVPVYVDQDWKPEPAPAAPARPVSHEELCAGDCNEKSHQGRLTVLGNTLPAMPMRTLELEGLYNVLIQYDEEVNETAKEEVVRTEVLKRLHEHRNLCEDYIDVISVNPKTFTIDASFVLKPDADPEQVLADVFATVHRYFSPTVRFYTIDEMLKKGYRVEEIFEGPALQSGFIDDSELERTDLFRDLRLSDIINDIADIDGIRAVTHFHIPREALNYEYFTEWITELREQRLVAKLDVGKSRALLCKESEIFKYNEESPLISRRRVQKLYHDIIARERGYRLKGHDTDFPIPVGEYSDLDVYIPIQNDLPHIYGVNPLYGVPGAPDQELREIQVKQLRGFLLLFDQLLANHLSQIAHLNNLFSFCDNQQTQYFSVLHNEIAGLEDLLVGDEDLVNWNNEYTALSLRKKEKEVDLEFEKEELALLEALLPAIEQNLKLHPDDKKIKRKLHAALEDIAEEKNEISTLETEIEHISDKLEEIEKKISNANQIAGNLEQHFGKILRALLDPPAGFVMRRNRMLDHLLARFGEDMTAYSELMRKWRESSEDDIEQRLIADKTRLLQDYLRAGSERGTGFNYFLTAPENKDEEKANKQKTWGGSNISGVERRVSRLLGFSKAVRQHLTPSWIEVKYQPEVTGETPKAIIHFFTDDAEHTPLFYSREIPAGECCIDEFIMSILDRGADSAGYYIESDEYAGKIAYFFQLDDEEKAEIGKSRYFNTEEDAADGLKRFTTQLNELADIEGLHLIEHILLRPKTDEVLQYADEDPNDQLVPPVEPVELLDIELDACDVCEDGNCYYKIVEVEPKPESNNSGKFEINFTSPFDIEKSLEVKSTEKVNPIPNLDAKQKDAFIKAMFDLNNYNLTSIDQTNKKITVSHIVDNDIVDIAQIIFSKPGKLKENEIKSAIRDALTKNVVLKFKNPFDNTNKVCFEVTTANNKTNLLESSLPDFLKAIYTAKNYQIINNNKTLEISSDSNGTKIKIAHINLSMVPTTIDLDTQENKDLVISKIKDALTACVSVRNLFIRIKRLPADKCFNNEAWMLDISALSDPKDPNSDRISFFRKVYMTESTKHMPLLAFRSYEKLGRYRQAFMAVATEQNNYSVDGPQEGKFSVILSDDNGRTLAQTDYIFTDANAAQDWITQIRKSFALEQDRNCNCRACNNDEDPYSFRTTIVLPCWSRRAQYKPYRHFVEQTIRLEMPAHVDVRIAWLGMEAMRRFERKYRNWLTQFMKNAGFPELKVTNALVHELNHLADCGQCNDDCKELHIANH
jgi:hypothetical protein